jgi:uncharacterized Zn-binding protein involved in type VI secretion
MGQAAAKQGDRIIGNDMHQVGGVATPMPFTGLLMQGLSSNVNIMKKPAATVGSIAINTPPHPGATASNIGRIIMGSSKVMINGKPAARSGDTALTCNDGGDLPGGKVLALGSVNFG